jgi:hypothetical protein
MQLILTPPLLLLLWQMLPWLLLLSGCCDCYCDCDFRCCAAATSVAAATVAASTTAASSFIRCKCEVKIWMLNLLAN